jgi:PhnB protein
MPESVMPSPVPYLILPGTARPALEFYAQLFDCAAQWHTFAEFGRTDGPPEAVAHGYLTGGPVSVFAADAAGDQRPIRCEGLMLSLLGTAEPAVMREWFRGLSVEGRVLQSLEVRPWGDSDGQVVDRFGIHWLVGFEGDGVDASP